MGTVPHPLRAYLLKVQSSVRSVQERLTGQLDRPHQNFAAGNVWSGPTAESWGTQLSSQRTTYNLALANLGAEVADRLAATPLTCSEEEAQLWQRRLGNA
ncbi:hypothetical protein GCM10009804_68100 [Kribbella hippodromi]|uniref:WXG100 family type VII secretion target n=1 Tax=Kribbella hippodromi TaxID=434347 RepID=A0ABN2EBG3_9ACTN